MSTKRSSHIIERADDFDSSGDEESGCSSCCSAVLWFFSILIIIFTFPFSLCVCLKVVAEYERAVMFRLGRLLPGARGPGMFFIVPCLDDFVKVDLRTRSFDVPEQEILTRDSVTVRVDAVVYYKINNPQMSVTKVLNVYSSALLLSQTSLRSILGHHTLAEVLSKRDEIAETLQGLLDHATDAWGVLVERVEIKDVKLPHSMQRAMAKEAEANREAQAKVIAAEGEKQASRALKEAAMVMNENPSALQLRYLQTLSQVATERDSTIYFPLPMNTLGTSQMGGTKF